MASFDRGWRFHLGEVAQAEGVDFNDAGWRALDIPHDWMIEGVPGADPAKMEGPFDPAPESGSARMNGGIGWYRKTFTVPEADKGKRISILFDGAYMDADVYLNGQKLGNHPYGFTSFSFDLTPTLKFGAEKNVLAVRLNVEPYICRWYSGAGLYRHVWLITTNPLHIAQWGTTVTTPKALADDAEIHVKTELVNEAATPATAFLTTILLDPKGREMARHESTSPVAANASATLDQSFALKEAKLWSPDSPALYRCLNEVWLDGKLVDSTVTPFGIRTVEFTKDQGMLLNGKRIQVNGVCDHHDLGCLGSVALKRGFQRQLEILKGMGCNALRTSHNPPSPELLDLCDQMGIMVMDECFDEWKENKVPNGYGRFFDAWAEKDLTSMLRWDRNHPSIILWSIGNEIPEGAKPSGPVLGKPLADLCHREDPTRLVTSALPFIHESLQYGFTKILDVIGINYNEKIYGLPELKGQQPLIASETASTVDSRGDYEWTVNAEGEIELQQEPNDKTFQLSCYDDWSPFWTTNAETEEIALKNAPWVAGEFVWTGFDYLGEPTPYPWPARSSYFGIIDLCGFPKDRYYMYRTQWQSTPLVHIMPHWTWTGLEGKVIPVWVYSNADAVELFLNGKSLGTKRIPDDFATADHNFTTEKGVLVRNSGLPSLHLAWSVPYAAGELKAVATKAGKIVASDVERTAGAPARLKLTADRRRMAGDGDDLCFLTVSILDKDGTICPDAAHEIHFELVGDAARIAGLDNGDATNHEAFQGTEHKAYHGLALAVLRSRAGGDGAVTLTASADGLSAASVEVAVRRP